MAEVAPIIELPWHRPHWERLMQALGQGRLPHALLLTGALGIGKRQFANRLAARLLCATPSPSGWPCGTCKGCQLRSAGTHPDLLLIEPEEPGKAIKIDVIRDFTGSESLTSQMGGYKVIIIEPADALNTNAANSLLKTLEEPVAQTIIILVTAQPARLPATIRSRCNLYHFGMPEREQALDWLTQALGAESDPRLLLSLASGAPLQAVALSDPELLAEREKMLSELMGLLKQQSDPVAVALRWDSLELSRVIHWFSGWVTDILRLQVNPDYADITNIDQINLLRDLGRQVKSKRLHQMLDGLYQVKRALGSQLNSQMLLEGLLVEWSMLGEAE